MTCYARSGGTLLNQCLLAIPGHMILSEISPLRHHEGVPHLRQQAADWYGIVLQETSFTDCIRELHEHAVARNQQLILRDWPLRCFEGVGPESPDAPGKLVLKDHLPPEIPIKSFAFVRDTYDVFLSRPWGKGFLSRYLSYVKCLLQSEMPRFHYEEFCKKPKTVFKEICDYTGIVYNPDFVKAFNQQKNVTGDISLGHLSRGQQCDEISVLPRRIPTLTQLKEMTGTSALREANHLLGYSTHYFSKNISWPWRRNPTSPSPTHQK